MEVRSIEAVIRALNEGGIHYVVVGGLAVNAHGYERLKLWSDIHLRTSLDVFGYEPFDFESEYARAEGMEVAPGPCRSIRDP